MICCQHLARSSLFFFFFLLFCSTVILFFERSLFIQGLVDHIDFRFIDIRLFTFFPPPFLCVLLLVDVIRLFFNPNSQPWICVHNRFVRLSSSRPRAKQDMYTLVLPTIHEKSHPTFYFREHVINDLTTSLRGTFLRWDKNVLFS